MQAGTTHEAPVCVHEANAAVCRRGHNGLVSLARFALSVPQHLHSHSMKASLASRISCSAFMRSFAASSLGMSFPGLSLASCIAADFAPLPSVGDSSISLKNSVQNSLSLRSCSEVSLPTTPSLRTGQTRAAVSL